MSDCTNVPKVQQLQLHLIVDGQPPLSIPITDIDAARAAELEQHCQELKRLAGVGNDDGGNHNADAHFLACGFISQLRAHAEISEFAFLTTRSGHSRKRR